MLAKFVFENGVEAVWNNDGSWFSSSSRTQMILESTAGSMLLNHSPALGDPIIWVFERMKDELSPRKAELLYKSISPGVGEVVY